jgi:hypothetical protein
MWVPILLLNMQALMFSLTGIHMTTFFTFFSTTERRPDNNIIYDRSDALLSQLLLTFQSGLPLEIGLMFANAVYRVLASLLRLQLMVIAREC